MPKLFGTDGMRGRAFEAPLDESTVRRLGTALAEELGDSDPAPLLLAGDTRGSTTLLASWLAEAYQAAGGHIVWGGVLPTPAVSHLLREGSFLAGVVISASHNPADDNGIKVLSSNGEKVPDAVERRLETRLAIARPRPGPPLPEHDRTLAERYLQVLHRSHDIKRPLQGLHVVVDAAHGAAYGLATRYLEELGAQVTAISDSPDGTNINADCGATSPDLLARAVVTSGAHAGLALDGDADRAVLTDEHGKVLDGDDILLVWGRHLAASGRLPGRTIVATVMSNYGLQRMLAAENIGLRRCPVGDRSVWQAMRRHSAALGGEQSGHIICSHHGVTGDGLLTGTHVLAIAAASGHPLSELSDLERMPQVLLNVRVARKVPFAEVRTVADLLRQLEGELEGHGRVLLRYSGTEQLARVMVEGDDEAMIRAGAQRLAEVIEQELGTSRVVSA
jgi:phosphoglucosamine mutase